MAIIRKSELKQMNESQLKSKLVDLKKELMRYNAQISTKTTPENPGKIKELKKTIAKVLTKLNQLEKSAKEETKKQV